MLTGEADRTVCELVTELMRSPRPTSDAAESRGLPRAMSVAAESRGGRGHAVGIQGVIHAGEIGNDSVRRPAPRQPERHLDELPWPAWDLIDVERYRRAWGEAHGYFSLNMVSTRGCPFHCNWCAKPIWGQRYAMRSPRNVAEELALRQAARCDPITSGSPTTSSGCGREWVAEFAAEVERARRCTRAVHDPVARRPDDRPAAVAALASAGCARCGSASRAAASRSSTRWRRASASTDVEPARGGWERPASASASSSSSAIPARRSTRSWRTVELVRGSLPDEIGVSVSYPLPGTRFP